MREGGGGYSYVRRSALQREAQHAPQAPRAAAASTWPLLLCVVLLAAYTFITQIRGPPTIVIEGRSVDTDDVRRGLTLVRTLADLSDGTQSEQRQSVHRKDGPFHAPGDGKPASYSHTVHPHALALLTELRQSLRRVAHDLLSPSGSLSVAGHEALPGSAVYRAREALAKNYQPGTIPKIIHQVFGLYGVGDSGGPLPRWAQDSMDSFRMLNPDHTHILWGPADIDEFVDQYFPSLAATFRSLNLPVLKADWSRYLLVYTFGGVYSDLDTNCLKPVARWAAGHSNVSAIVGIEADGKDVKEWYKSWGRQLQICQWTFAAEPAHPILALTVFGITRKLLALSPGHITQRQVTHTTGPSVFTDAVYEYMEMQGHHWQEYLGMRHATEIGDLYMASITGFSPGVGHMGARSTEDPEALVWHAFKGSWTKQGTQEEQKQKQQGGTQHQEAIRPWPTQQWPAQQGAAQQQGMQLGTQQRHQGRKEGDQAKSSSSNGSAGGVGSSVGGGSSDQG